MTSMKPKDKTAPPPGTPKSQSWVSHTKSTIIAHDETSNRQRLFTAQIAANHAILLTFQHFNLRPLTNNHIITLDCNDIIRGVIHKWNDTILFKWCGVQDRNNLLSTIQWEGYLNRSMNYVCQYKNKVSDALWVRSLQQCIVQIDTISMAQYPQHDELQHAFASCLKYSCLYSLCVAEISFFHCKAKPLIIDTALTKNPTFKGYLASMYPQITLSQWQIWELEETPKVTKKDKICARVRRRCLEYIENALQHEFRAFYSLLGGMTIMNDIDFDAFKVNIKFDKQGNAKEYSEFDPTPYICNTHFTPAFYCEHAPDIEKKTTKTKRKKANNTIERRPQTNTNHREFQRVSAYGMERRNEFGNRERTGVIRRRNVDAHVQRLHQNYNVEMQSDNVSDLNISSEAPRHPSEIDLLRENEELRCQYQYVLHQLQSMQQRFLPPMVDPFSVHGTQYNHSPHVPMEYVPSVPVNHMHVAPVMDEGVCCNPWREW